MNVLQSDASGSTTSSLPWSQPLVGPTPQNVGKAQTRAAAGSQNIVKAFIRGSQEYKTIAHFLPMKLVGRASFFEAQES